MQKIFRGNRIIGFAFLTIFSLGLTGEIHANDSTRVDQVIPVELQWIGQYYGQPLLQLNLIGDATQRDFTITIRDESNEVLYRENIRAEIFSKKFLLDSDELGDANLLFEIYSRSTNQTVTYRVNAIQTFSRNSIIEKIK